MDVAQLLEAVEFSCTFFNASTGAARVDLTVNVVIQDESGTEIVASTPASVKGTRYAYTPTGALLDGAGVYTAIFTPTVTTNVAPVVRIVPIRVGQTWIQRIDAAISSITGTTPAQIWDYLTSAADVAGSMKEFILAKLGLITSGGSVNYSAPVSPNGERITVIQSQDYLAADGGQLPEWTSQDWLPFSLTTAQSVTWYARSKYNPLQSGAVNVISNTELDIRTFANAITKQFVPGRDEYDLQVWAVLNAGTHGGAQKLLVSAKMSVIDDVRT